jgi:hypothetical protein
VAIDLTVPEWLKIKVAFWIDTLGMGEWEVAIGLALAPNSDPDCMGMTEQHANLNFGRITFRIDIVDNAEWEQIIVHELLHIKHSRIDHYIEDVMIPLMDGSLVCSMTYRQMIEPYIHSMAACLVRMKQ